MSPKRPGSVADRDVLVHKHPTPVAGVPVELPDEVTGQFEGDELAEKRAKRPTHERLARLEAKHDESTKAINAVNVTLAGMGGKLDTLLAIVERDRDNAHKTERVRLSTRGKVIIGVVSALCSAAVGIVAAALAGCF